MCKNYNSSKRSLVTTLVVLAICAVIVTGSTFSLFTSKTGVNIAITAGSVKMTATIDEALTLYSKDVEQTTGNFENGGTATLNDKKTELEITNITPGDKVELTINLKNESNVDVAYRVTWSVEGKLAEVLTGTVDGNPFTAGTSEWTKWSIPANEDAKTKTITLAVAFPMDIKKIDGKEINYNDYQGKTANISFAVEAVQANGTAEYDSTAYVNTEAGLQAAIDAGATKIVLNNDIKLDQPLILGGNSYSLRTVPQILTFDLNGNEIIGAIGKDLGAVVINNGNFKIVGGTIQNTAVNGGATIQNNGTLVLDGVTVIGAPIADGDYPEYAIVNAGNLTVEEGTEVSSNRGCLSVIAEGYTLINGGTFTNNDIGARVLTSHVVYIKSSANNKLTINGGIFQHLHKATSGGVVINNSSAVPAEINGGSFSGGNYYGNDNLSDYGYGSSTNPSFVVTGGAYSAKPNAKYIANGYKVCELDGAYIVLDKDTFLAFDEEEFDYGYGYNSTYILARDVDSTKVIYFGNDTENTIYLNGKTLTSTGGFLFGAQNSAVINIEGSGNITTGSGYAGFVSSYGKINIYGGTFNLGETNNQGSFFCQNSGTIVIKDGTFISSDANTPILYCINGFIEIKGGFFQNTANPKAALLGMGNNLNYANNQKITLSGGTFVNWNPMTSAFAQAWTNPDVPALIVLADGYQMVAETQTNGDVWYTVVPVV